ncbi:polymer-forming cytoskeletal protein [Brevibacterium sp. JNUCC-42]|nr:polymer-forming cytoskeletal protein [Brevibacterium sp. JNUCC-42]
MSKKLFFLSFLLCFCLILASSVAAINIHNEELYHVKSNEVHHGDVVTNASKVVIEGTVDGDLYAFAEMIDIKGTVTGDVISFAYLTNVSGTVGGNVRSYSQALTVSGTIQKNISAGADQLHINQSGNVNGSILGFVNEINIEGRVGKETNGMYHLATFSGLLEQGTSLFQVETLHLKPTAVINSDLLYSSFEPAQIDAGAYIKGEHKHTFIEPRPSFHSFMLMMSISSCLSTLIFWLLIRYFFAGSLYNVGEKLHTRHPFKQFGIGLLIFIIAPLISIGMLLTVVGIPVGITIAIAYALLLILGKVYVGTWLGQKLISRFHWKIAPLLAEFIGVFLLVVIIQIPLLGFLLGILVSIYFLGAITSCVRASNKRTAL